MMGFMWIQGPGAENVNRTLALDRMGSSWRVHEWVFMACSFKARQTASPPIWGMAITLAHPSRLPLHNSSGRHPE